MATTPRQVIDSVVRSVCGHEIEQLVRLTSGGMVLLTSERISQPLNDPLPRGNVPVE